jgi:hypothetical protein
MLSLVAMLAPLLVAQAPTLPKAGATPASSPAAKPTTKAPTTTGEMLIWSGADQRAKAEAQLEKLAPLVDALEGLFTLTPTILESATVPGLKPGFFVVAVAVCDRAGLAGAQKILGGIRPPVYTRSVEHPLSCPSLGIVDAPDSDDEVRWQLDQLERVELPGKRQLVGLRFSYRFDQRGDFAQSFFDSRAVFAVLDESGAVLGAEVVDPPGDAATGALARGADTLRFVVDYADPRCDPSADRFVKWHGETSARAAPQLVVSTGKPTKVEAGGCGYASEAEMITGGPPGGDDDGGGGDDEGSRP